MALGTCSIPSQELSSSLLSSTLPSSSPLHLLCSVCLLRLAPRHCFQQDVFSVSGPARERLFPVCKRESELGVQNGADLCKWKFPPLVSDWSVIMQRMTPKSYNSIGPKELSWSVRMKLFWLAEDADRDIAAQLHQMGKIIVLLVEMQLQELFHEGWLRCQEYRAGGKQFSVDLSQKLI